MQARENQYLFPFAASSSKGAILRFEDKALGRGVLSWRGEKNLCDRNLVLCGGPSTWPLPDPKSPRLGGDAQEHDLQLVDLTFRKLELDQLEPIDKRLNRTLLAPALMGTAAREVAAAPEPSPGAAATDLMSPRTFWILLAGAMIVLLGLIVRLVRTA